MSKKKSAAEPVEYIDSQAFDAAKEKIIGKSHNDKGIGTLSEKTLHAVLKMYYEPDEDNHEVAIDGYFADILARIQLISFIKSLLLPSLERIFSNIFLKAIKSESSPDIRSSLHSMVTT